MMKTFMTFYQNFMGQTDEQQSHLVKSWERFINLINYDLNLATFFIPGFCPDKILARKTGKQKIRKVNEYLLQTC